MIQSVINSSINPMINGMLDMVDTYKNQGIDMTTEYINQILQIIQDPDDLYNQINGYIADSYNIYNNTKPFIMMLINLLFVVLIVFVLIFIITNCWCKCCFCIGNMTIITLMMILSIMIGAFLLLSKVTNDFCTYYPEVINGTSDMFNYISNQKEIIWNILQCNDSILDIITPNYVYDILTDFNISHYLPFDISSYDNYLDIINDIDVINIMNSFGMNISELINGFGIESMFSSFSNMTDSIDELVDYANIDFNTTELTDAINEAIVLFSDIENFGWNYTYINEFIDLISNFLDSSDLLSSTCHDQFILPVLYENVEDNLIVIEDCWKQDVSYGVDGDFTATVDYMEGNLTYVTNFGKLENELIYLSGNITSQFDNLDDIIDIISSFITNINNNKQNILDIADDLTIGLYNIPNDIVNLIINNITAVQAYAKNNIIIPLYNDIQPFISCSIIGDSYSILNNFICNDTATFIDSIGIYYIFSYITLLYIFIIGLFGINIKNKKKKHNYNTNMIEMQPVTMYPPFYNA